MSKEVLGMITTRIGRVIMIWDKVFFTIRVSFDGMVSRKKVLLGSSNGIEIYLDVVVKVLELHGSIDFELCIEEEFI